jgi:hypothetical protein
MRPAFIAALVGAAVAGSVALSAQQPRFEAPSIQRSAQPAPSGTPSLFTVTDAQNPFARSSAAGTKDLERRARSALQQQLSKQRVQPQPVVVCGLTLVPGDPNVDADIRHTVPDGSQYTMPRVVPQVCRR